MELSDVVVYSTEKDLSYIKVPKRYFSAAVITLDDILNSDPPFEREISSYPVYFYKVNKIVIVKSR